MKNNLILHHKFLHLRHQNIELLPDGQAIFVGPSDDNEEAACIRSNAPIPNETGVRYTCRKSIIYDYILHFPYLHFQKLNLPQKF